MSQDDIVNGLDLLSKEEGYQVGRRAEVIHA